MEDDASRLGVERSGAQQLVLRFFHHPTGLTLSFFFAEVLPLLQSAYDWIITVIHSMENPFLASSATADQSNQPCMMLM